MTISYDATSQSYTINTSNGSRTFRPQDQTASDSNATYYSWTNGSDDDSLMLTKAGDSGAFNYRYVAAGLKRYRAGSGTAEGMLTRLDAFTYGIRTADAAVPTSGTGSFAIGITGNQALGDAVGRFDGTGLLTMDFANLAFTGSGLLTIRYPSNRYPARSDGPYSPYFGRFATSGILGTGRNQFTGTIDLELLGAFQAALDGRFYGPAAEEVGATFAGPGPGNRTVVGAIIGRRGNAALEYETLGSLLTPVMVPASYSSLSYVDNGAGTSFSSVALGRGDGAIVIDPAPPSYSAGPDFGPANKVPEQSDARFTTYRIGSGENQTVYRVYNVGSGNDQLVLSYATFLQRQFVGPAGARFNEASIFGLLSNYSYLPRSGHGLYQGVLHGSAIGSDSNADRFALTGTAGFDFDFGAASFTGTLNPTATNLRTNVASSLGTFTFANGSVPGYNGMSVAFFGDIVGAPGATGRIDGRFYGPNAQEIAAIFSLTTPGAGTTLTGIGAVVGKAQ
ncbi:MAG: transferrin-binding protein-like solute binding protein [Proteobacteria bacterium]|nr:transferrin-binding protein-like solute binding protein [Pseudomonadota bacterium]